MEKSETTQPANRSHATLHATPYWNDDDIDTSQESIQQHWSNFPPQAKSFILDTPNDFSGSRLVNFWSLPQNFPFTCGGLAVSITGTASYLALVYLKLGMLRQARKLVIHGSFIHQCCNSSIGEVKKLFISNDHTSESLKQALPLYFRGLDSMKSPVTMEEYIRSHLPKGYTWANLRTKKKLKGHIEQVADDLNSTFSQRKKSLQSFASKSSNGTQIELILVDENNKDIQTSFVIDSTTALKTLFKDCAYKRGVSLRSLRFFHAEKILFLSSVGNKTAEELGMQDQDVIVVRDLSKPEEPKHNIRSSKKNTGTSSPACKKNKAERSKKKSSGRSKREQPQEKTVYKTLEESKIEHSKQLTKIHGEAQAQFKQIRQRLNNLVIMRSQPKIKPKRTCTLKPKSIISPVLSNPFGDGLGGKAGKSCYAIQVGEVQHLYKTARPCSMSSYSSSIRNPSSVLDLHGCTREEALAKLDDSLKVWVNSAMQGSYPFVQKAWIVCGCGDQILSGTVQDWIRCNDHVSNAPNVRRG